MKDKHQIKKLHKGVRLLLSKNGYTFTESDKALLEDILVELEEMLSKLDQDANQNQILDMISLLLRFLKFFGFDEISDLF